MTTFKNRSEAGKLLAKRLLKYAGADTVVLALPRGGVPVGHEVALALHAPLDVMVIKKIGHPENQEYAIGAVNERGAYVLDHNEIWKLSSQWLNHSIWNSWSEAVRRANFYRLHRPPPELGNKTVIITDDGAATGLTIRLAVRQAVKQKPDKIIVAVPVAPPGFTDEMKAEGADEVLELLPEEGYQGAVGAHYQNFGQVTHKEVMTLLDKHFKGKNKTITLCEEGDYRLVETMDHHKMLYLGNQAYMWSYAKSIGELLTFSKSPHQENYELAEGKYRIYKVKNAPKLVDLPHLELSIAKNKWQSYLLLTGLPTKDRIRRRIVPSREVISSRYVLNSEKDVSVS